jgi:hypothetical protein
MNDTLKGKPLKSLSSWVLIINSDDAKYLMLEKTESRCKELEMENEALRKKLNEATASVSTSVTTASLLTSQQKENNDLQKKVRLLEEQLLLAERVCYSIPCECIFYIFYF